LTSLSNPDVKFDFRVSFACNVAVAAMLRSVERRALGANFGYKLHVVLKSTGEHRRTQLIRACALTP
jgi:hypothetical protein